MKLWLISQSRHKNYGTYDSAVVCAETEEEAKMIHPSGNENWDWKSDHCYDSWCAVKYVKVEYIGEAKEDSKKGVVCASFNAG